MSIDNYPKFLTEGREITEGNFIFCLWKEPELYGDYAREINTLKDFITEDGLFYYGLGLQMYNQGYKTFDDVSIYSYTADKETLKNGYERRGGIRTVDEIRRVLDVENVEMYFDNLVKSNILITLHEKGFQIENNMDKFKKMNSKQVYDFFEYQLDNTFLNRGSGAKIEDLDIDSEFIKACDSGEEMGLSYASACPLLNFHTLGIHRANVQIMAGFSGTGKSSFCVNSYILPILDQGESVVIVANEMNKRAWQHILMATILQQKIGYYGIGRKKQKMGGLNDEQKAKMQEAIDYYNEHYKGRLKFAKIYDYSIGDVKKVIRRMAKRGFNYALYDTFKAGDASSATVTGDLIEDSKQLLQVAEKEDIGIIITMQLAIHMENVRYLTGSTLSNSKAVKEVVSELILMRTLWEDEYTGQKYDVKPYKFKRDMNGKYTKVREEITLDPDKKYRILFIDKSRNDEGQVALLYLFDGAWNKWKELGYCTPKHQR